MAAPPEVVAQAEEMMKSMTPQAKQQTYIQLRASLAKGETLSPVNQEVYRQLDLMVEAAKKRASMSAAPPGADQVAAAASALTPQQRAQAYALLKAAVEKGQTLNPQQQMMYQYLTKQIEASASPPAGILFVFGVFSTNFV